MIKIKPVHTRIVCGYAAHQMTVRWPQHAAAAAALYICGYTCSYRTTA